MIASLFTRERGRFPLKKISRARILAAAAVCALAAAVGIIHMAATSPSALAASAESGVPLPILMYHSILRDPAKTGAYVIRPESVEADLIWLRDHGYETVTVADLLAYVADGTPLPERPVMITLDDGNLNNATYLLPLLEKYDMRAVISVVGSYCEAYSAHPDPNPAYAYLSWAELRALDESGRVEIQNHSYDMHRLTGRAGAGRIPGEDDSAYRRALTADARRTQQLLADCCGIRPTAYVYPYGNRGQGADAILADMGFRCTMTCEERVNRITRDPQSLFSLGRYNRSGLVSTGEIMRKIFGEPVE